MKIFAVIKSFKMSKRSIILSIGGVGLSLLLLLGTGIFNYGFADELIHSGCKKYTCAYMNINVSGYCRIILNGVIECNVHRACPKNTTVLLPCYDNHHTISDHSFCPKDSTCTQIEREHLISIITLICLIVGASILIGSLAIFCKDYFFDNTVDWETRKYYEPINNPIVV